MIDNGYRRVHNEEDVMMPGFLHTLRTKDDEQLFWNLIYYFNMFHLPFEFMLPYKTSDQADSAEKIVFNSEQIMNKETGKMEGFLVFGDNGKRQSQSQTPQKAKKGKPKKH